MFTMSVTETDGVSGNEKVGDIQRDFGKLDPTEILCREYQVGGQHSAFIRDNLATLTKKCNEFQECIQELYTAENFHSVLAGEDLQLTNICGLMYAYGGDSYTTLKEECSTIERTAIRNDLNRRLTETLNDPSAETNKGPWRKLNTCVDDRRLEKPSGQMESSIDTVCRVAKNSTKLCNETEVHTTTEKFFNHELEHLHCSCSAIKAEAEKGLNQNESTGLPAAARIGISAGIIGLIVFLIVLVGVLCYKHRKVKRRLSKTTMRYMPNPNGDEPSAIYQEINDPHPGMGALRGKDRAVTNPHMPGYNYNFLGPAPALPDRYVKHGNLTRSMENIAGQVEDIPEYLEPIADPRSDTSMKSPAVSNISYFGREGGSSAGGSERSAGGSSGRSAGRGGGGSGRGEGSGRYEGSGRGEGSGRYEGSGRGEGSGRSRPAEGPYQVSQLPGMQPRGVSPTRFPGEGTYFSHINRADSHDEDGGYSTLGRNKKEAKENSGDSGVGSTGAGNTDPRITEEPEDAVFSETAPLNKPDQPKSPANKYGPSDEDEPKYFVLEPERGSGAPASPSLDEKVPLTQPEQSPGPDAGKHRRYRPKHPRNKDTNSTVV